VYKDITISNNIAVRGTDKSGNIQLIKKFH